MTITRTPKNSHKISQQQQQEKIQKIGASEKDRQKKRNSASRATSIHFTTARKRMKKRAAANNVFPKGVFFFLWGLYRGFSEMRQAQTMRDSQQEMIKKTCTVAQKYDDRFFV